ncbi:MAG: AraC family transcriptional regulator [Chitinophagaceae bacterium]
MKASFESIKTIGQASFLARQFEETSFAAPYHFHPEYELTLIVKGSGKRYVGTHMHDYSAGDLVLLGSNLPHCWKTSPAETGTTSISVVIQFQKDFLGMDFFAVPETKRIYQLLDNSQAGIRFTGNTAAVQQKMQHILDEPDNFRRLLSMLDILHDLATANDYILLDKQTAAPAVSIQEKERMHAVMAYIVENFQNNISLGAVAAVSNMTPEAFCKYFKKLSRKTFIEVVNDYRVDFALGQLINTEKPVAQIGFDSGFNDLSNFYKTFKDRNSLSPLAYRKAFNRKMI